VLRRPETLGANVTIPYKETIIGEIDEMSLTANRIGAVNTIVHTGKGLEGYNTDIAGAGRALEESNKQLEDITVVVIGAGGGAKAVSYFLAQKAIEIRILNRTISKASNLAYHLSKLPECRAKIDSRALNPRCLEKALQGASILINATPIGMFPNIDKTPVEADLLRSDLLVFDLIYNPPKTMLLQKAEEVGADILTGVKMLVYQGMEAFKLWTKREAPEELMFHVVEKALGLRDT
jgi:shikimate dehydrogenase